jgi:hypothetical protein
MFQRSWYVVLTDRRVFVVPLGLLMGKLFLRRAADGRVLKLRFLFRYRNDAVAIKDALGG